MSRHEYTCRKTPLISNLTHLGNQPIGLAVGQATRTQSTHANFPVVFPEKQTP
ncbi:MULTISPECIES: hypothetical protein [unclassified Moorena]|uniref:hypothetical protein n=1 Tax=unclassified Moorena TaxID=2683338 RepID=UPI0013B715FE|nr:MULTISPECIES: hypothetical protein [unclassified Moorena]NEP31078.1 hypothetical protein [Moorena sp. SIO3B2]NEQ05131.1 hypothetical protein [Moorena sp. SIO4E2]NEQ12939.1 hypothetical protein [Moorena sp. SIO3E2]NES40503.1 hypothetical protein [Moorena sp. SIO2C4]NER85708.1 hypothetical protein [Moorena sp. SIO3A2]